MTVYGPAAPVKACTAVARPWATVTVTGAVPSPKSKVTVPPGVPAPGASGVTRAKNVTGSPVTDGSGRPLTVVVLAPGPTVWERVPAAGAKSASPR
ncbi:hypothetical protein O1L68_43775 [Streptomyces lydicus]|nr:hypothetical protein [Streptomyces lydicus]